MTQRRDRQIKFSWLDNLQLFHTTIFWSILFTALVNMSELINIEWGILFQFWILNLFVYLFVSVGNAIKLPIEFIGMYLFYIGLYGVMITYSLSRF